MVLTKVKFYLKRQLIICIIYPSNFNAYAGEFNPGFYVKNLFFWG
jgi:hypothetical protein